MYTAKVHDRAVRLRCTTELCSGGVGGTSRHIRKSAAPIGFSAVDFLVIPEISQAIFPT